MRSEPEAVRPREPAFLRRYRAIAAGALCPRCGYAIVAREGLDAGARPVRHCPECGFPTRLMRRLGEPYRGTACNHSHPVMFSGFLRLIAGLLAGCWFAIPVFSVAMLSLAGQGLPVILMPFGMASALLIFVIAASIFFRGDRIDRAVGARDRVRGTWWIVMFWVSVAVASFCFVVGLLQAVGATSIVNMQRNWAWHAFMPTLAAAASALLMIAALLARRTAAIALRLDDLQLLRRSVRVHTCARTVLIAVLLGYAGAWVVYALGWGYSVLVALLGGVSIVIGVGLGVMWMLRPLRRHEVLLGVS